MARFAPVRASDPARVLDVDVRVRRLLLERWIAVEVTARTSAQIRQPSAWLSRLKTHVRALAESPQ